SGKMLAGTWTVTEVNGREMPADSLRAFTLSFEPADSTFSCETGCNVINGKYVSGYTDLKLDPTMSTRMMCDSLGNAIESDFIEVIPQITSFGQLASGNIGLYNSTNDMLMILAAQ
ncbi:MAG: META domain-containing protein, partial [Muribaculaceae bacterium]|nr:META domain-containing protein [Muribaculaceae bacterium]